MKKETAKKYTINDVMKRLGSLDERMSKGFDSVDKDIGNLAISMAKGFVAVNARLDKHEDIFHTMDLRMSGLEGDMLTVKNTLQSFARWAGSTDSDIHKLDSRVAHLENTKGR